MKNKQKPQIINHLQKNRKKLKTIQINGLMQRKKKFIKLQIQMMINLFMKTWHKQNMINYFMKQLFRLEKKWTNHLMNFKKKIKKKRRKKKLKKIRKKKKKRMQKVPLWIRQILEQINFKAKMGIHNSSQMYPWRRLWPTQIKLRTKVKHLVLLQLKTWRSRQLQLWRSSHQKLLIRLSRSMSNY